MAIRNIRKENDEILRKVSKEVPEINEKIRILLKDMADTMYDADGVGLAAPQIGMLKRVIVVDAGEGLIGLINPKIVMETGEQIKIEGCLSFPGIFGEVKRPAMVMVEGLDASGRKVDIEGKELLAVALCHEIDHLNGVVFKDRVIRFIDKSELENR